MNKLFSLRTAAVFTLGLGCGIGMGEWRREPVPLLPAPAPPPTPRAAAAVPPPKLVADADAAVKAVHDATDGILARLADPSLSTPDRVAHVRALGRFATLKAIDYLLANHTFGVPTPERNGGIDDRPRMPDKPCRDALADAGVAAVPRLVEAYCTWPPEKAPQSLLSVFLKNHPTLGGERSRVAYLLAQGYLFAYRDTHFHRERTLELIYHLVPHATDEKTLFYPAPWMPNPAMPDAVVPESPAKKP